MGSNSFGDKSWPQYDKMVKCFGEFTEEYKRHVDLYYKTFKKNQRERVSAGDGGIGEQEGQGEAQAIRSA